MDVIYNLVLGFGVALQPSSLLMCFIGVLLGTLVGVLPGLGPVAAMSLLLPVTYNVSPVNAIIMLSGMYYGSMYGGSTTSILLNIPGEAASVVTCLALLVTCWEARMGSPMQQAPRWMPPWGRKSVQSGNPVPAMRSLARLAAPTLFAAALLGCAALTGTVPSGGPWESAVQRGHPLLGSIWDVRAARFVDERTLVDGLGHGRFVLLGEKHDNADHHRLQARLVRALIATGRRPAVLFEMLDADQAPALARYLASHPADAAGLDEAVGWKRSGWPDWSFYRPIAEAALGAGLPILAANLSRATTRSLARDGLAALDPREAARLGLDRPLASSTEAQMAAEIREAHCGTASEAMIGKMVLVQRARDAQMGERMVEAARGDGAVLIAGFGHVRSDRGVPAHLGWQVPGASVVSVAFLEVIAGEVKPGAYAAAFERRVLPFDYVWFTPRVDDIDPCEKFKEDLRAPRRSS